MTATTVFLVRYAAHEHQGRALHGRTPGVSLGEGGRATAGRIAERLSRERLTGVYSGPLDLARQTGEPIAASVGQQLQVCGDLDEFDYGDWSGRSFEDLRDDPAWSVWNVDRLHRRPPMGETLLELQSRVMRWFDYARERHPGERLAAVSHGESIKAALLCAIGAPLDALGRLGVEPGSISVIVGGDWGFKVCGVNEVIA